ncbi:transposase [Nostoc punctiforme UO1]
MVLGKSECLKIAYEMKEKFREIYETNLTVKKGQKKIQEWLNHAQVFFRESASTIENHLEGICNYFLNRTTSGVMEGINNRIKLIMRQGYGFSNFNNFRNRILDLPGAKVESCTQIDGKILLGLRIVGEGMVCHHCQNYTEQLHQNRPILVKDLPVFGRPVYLKVPRRQFYCPNCQRYPTEKLDFLDIKRRHTQRYEQNIYERVKQSSMEQIGREEGLSYDEIKGIFDRVNKTQKKPNWEQVKRICLDEVSMRKGQGNFETVVADISEGNLIEMIDSHRSEEIIEVLLHQQLKIIWRVFATTF